MYRAVQASQWQAAVTAYSEAINACADAPAVFAAVLHSNRAAAYQALHQYADAVADNLRARALDPSYGKVGFAAVKQCYHATCPFPFTFIQALPFMLCWYWVHLVGLLT